MDTIINGTLRSIELVLAIGAIIMALGAGMRRIYRTAKNIDDLLEKVTDNHARMTEAIHSIQHITHQVRDIKKEVLPNGGSSLRDAVNRIETRVAILETWHASEHRPHG